MTWLRDLYARIVDDITLVSAEVTAERKLAVEGIIVDATTGEPVNIDDSGQMHTVLMATQDPDNSTTTPLGIGGVFTGTETDVQAYAGIAINVTTDQDSAVMGLEAQFSKDNITWYAGEEYAVFANTRKFFTPPRQEKYFRVKYTNGTVAQGSFDVHVLLSKTPFKWSSHNISDTLSSNDDAELVKAVLAALKPDGDFANIGASDSGNLKTTDAENGLAIAKGEVEGSTFIHKFGNAPDFDTADGKITVWDGAEDGTGWELMNYVYSTTADIDQISSSSAADTQEVDIQGLDTNWELATQTITLTGQTPVALSTNLIRVFRAFNGNSTDLAGHVFVWVSGGGSTGGIPNTNADIRAIVDPDNQQTEMAVYTIPAGKTGYMRDWFISTSGGSKSSNYVFRIKSRLFGKVFRTKHTTALEALSPVPYQHQYSEPEVFLEKTDIEMQVESIATPASTENAVSAGFDIVLVDN